MTLAGLFSPPNHRSKCRARSLFQLDSNNCKFFFSILKKKSVCVIHLQELIQQLGVPAVFSDFCEEAANLAACCIEKVTQKALRLPVSRLPGFLGYLCGVIIHPCMHACMHDVQVQVNPFRQPMPVEDSALRIPCYSNCFLLGM